MDENKVEELVEVVEEVEEATEEKANFNQQVKDVLNEAKDYVTGAVADVMDKLDDVDLSKEALKGYLQQLSVTVNNAFTKVSEKVKEAGDQQRTKDAALKTKAAAEKVVNDVKTTATNAYNKAMENEKVKTTVDKVASKTKEVTAAANEKYTAFTHDPKVRETVVTSVKAVTDIFNKTVETVKTVFVKNEEEVEEVEIEIQEEKKEEE